MRSYNDRKAQQSESTLCIIKAVSHPSMMSAPKRPPTYPKSTNLLTNKKNTIVNQKNPP